MKFQCNKCGNEITVAVKQQFTKILEQRQLYSDLWANMESQFPEASQTDKMRKVAQMLNCSERTAWRVFARFQTSVEKGRQESLSGVSND